MALEISHISQRRMEKLVFDGILGSLIFICIECIEGKQINQRRYDAMKSLDVLELIHTDICGPFPSPSWNGTIFYHVYRRLFKI